MPRPCIWAAGVVKTRRLSCLLFRVPVARCREGPGRKTETVRVFATSQQAAETTRFAKRFARCFRVKESLVRTDTPVEIGAPAPTKRETLVVEAGTET